MPQIRAQIKRLTPASALAWTVAVGADLFAAFAALVLVYIRVLWFGGQGGWLPTLAIIAGLGLAGLFLTLIALGVYRQNRIALALGSAAFPLVVSYALLNLGDTKPSLLVSHRIVPAVAVLIAAVFIIELVRTRPRK